MTSISTDVLFVSYIRTIHLTKYSSIFFKNSPTCKKINHIKKVIENMNVFRKYSRVRQEVSDEIQTSISFIKNDLQTPIENNISCPKKNILV